MEEVRPWGFDHQYYLTDEFMIFVSTVFFP